MTDEHPLAAVESLALIALGGFAGANLRYAVALAGPPLVGVLAVNVAGSGVLGFVMYERRFVGAFSEPARIALGTGFLSSLTTYSTFAVATATATPLVAVGNVAANYTFGIAAAVAGWRLARRAGSDAVHAGESA